MAWKNKVTSISIEGYKSIKSLKSFELGPLNIMIGPNGAGKSNFISVFKFLNHISEQRLQSYVKKAGGASQILHFGSKQTQNIILGVEFGPNSYFANLGVSDSDSLFFEEEQCTYHDSRYTGPFSFSCLSLDGKETGLVEQQNGLIARSTLESIQSWKLYHFHDTSNTALMKKSCKIDDNASLRPDASNLAAYLYLLKEQYINNYNNIVDTIKLIAPFFSDFILQPSELSPDTIRLEWKHKDTDEYFDASSLSDGTLRFICLATLMLQPEVKLPTTILLDEPELGLHPAAIKLLASILVGTATKTQIIVSTQSVTLVNQMTPETIIVADRNDKETKFRRLDDSDLEAWVEDYGLGDMWEKNIIGGRP